MKEQHEGDRLDEPKSKNKKKAYPKIIKKRQTHAACDARAPTTTNPSTAMMGKLPRASKKRAKATQQERCISRAQASFGGHSCQEIPPKSIRVRFHRPIFPHPRIKYGGHCNHPPPLPIYAPKTSNYRPTNKDMHENITRRVEGSSILISAIIHAALPINNSVYLHFFSDSIR